MNILFFTYSKYLLSVPFHQSGSKLNTAKQASLKSFSLHVYTFIKIRIEIILYLLLCSLLFFTLNML